MIAELNEEIQNLRAELLIANAALERVIQNANLNLSACLVGGEHEAVQAVYELRCKYAKLRGF